MKKVVIRILSIFMMILMVISSVNVSCFAYHPATQEDADAISEQIYNIVIADMGENYIQPANEINNLIDGEPDGLLNDINTSKESLEYIRNFIEKLFNEEEYKQYLEERNYSDEAKYSVFSIWYNRMMTDCGDKIKCTYGCLNDIQCINEGHMEKGLCTNYAGAMCLLGQAAGIPIGIVSEIGHVDPLFIKNALVNNDDKKFVKISTDFTSLAFVSGNILYNFSLDYSGKLLCRKRYIITHEHDYSILKESVDATCVKKGYKIFTCSAHDEKTGVYCTSTNTIEFPIKPHTFNNRIFNKKFHAGEYSTEKNINNAADTTGELINGKMTYTNCDGTTVSTENYGGYYNDQPKLNIWGYNNTDQEGALVTNNFHACEVAEVNRYVCDRTLDTDDMLCDDEFLYEITEPEEVTYADKVIEATCDMGGYTLRTCNNCGESRKVNKSNTNALGCDFNGAELIVEKAPTCDTSILGQGYGYQICKHEGCNKTNSVTITERAKHNLSIVVSGYNDIESVVNDSCVDQYVYGYVYCSVCDRRIKPTDINESDYPDVYQKYSDICDFDEYGNVKITVKATGNHKFITAYEYDKNGNPIPCNLCVVCQYKEYHLNDDDSDNKTPDKDENDDEDKTPEIDEDEDINNPDVCTHKSTRYKTTKATYTKSGKRVYYCKKCGAVVKTVKISKLTLKVPNFKLYKGKKYFKVRYTKVKDATGFQVQYKIKGKWKLKTFKTKTTSIKFVKNLKKGKYIVRIRALRAVKGGYVYSNWSKIKSVSVK